MTRKRNKKKMIQKGEWRNGEKKGRSKKKTARLKKIDTKGKLHSGKEIQVKN